MSSAPVRILAYHSLAPWSGDRLGVEPDQFRRQLEWLAEHNWDCLGLDEWIRLSRENRRPDKPSVVITFDDGYADNLEFAAPILKDLGWSATVFVVTAALKNGSFPKSWPETIGGRIAASPRRSMTWNDLEKWCRLGFTVGSHTHSHPILPRLDREQRLAELRNSATLLEARLGIKEMCLCYPYGDVDPEVLADTRAAGYEGGLVTPSIGGVPKTRWTMHRIGVYGHDTLSRFRFKMSRAFPAVREVRHRTKSDRADFGVVRRNGPPKVLQLTSCQQIGGIERMMIRLVRALSRKGVCAEVLPTRPDGPAHDLLRSEQIENYQMLAGSVFSQVRWLRAQLRGGDWHVLHAYGGRAIILSRLAMIGFGPSRPKLVTGILSTFHGDGRVRRLLERLTLRWNDAYVSNSQAGADSAASWLGLDPDQIRVVYDGIPPVDNPIDNDRMQIRSNLGISGDCPILICVANFRPMKGHRVLLKAFESVSRIVLDAHLLLVGVDHMNGEIQRTASDLSSRDRIHFLGLRHDVQDLLTVADLFVLASDWEGLPISMLEAMRAALPIVATKVSGIPEAIRSGSEGWLVPPRDPVALTSAIMTLLEDREAAERIGRAARKRLIEKFTIDRTAEQLTEIYSELADQDWRGVEPAEARAAA